MKGSAPTVGLVRVDQITVHPHNIRQNLGDLRSLTASIKRHGIMQPVVVEKYAGRLRLRAGHRRVAAAKIAGIARVPAVIHEEALEDDEWLIASVQENVIRAKITDEERLRTVRALLDLGCSRDGVAETFGVTTSTVGSWLKPKPKKERGAEQQARGWTDGRLSGPKVRALIAEWRERDLDRDEILAELEGIFPPRTPFASADPAHRQARQSEALAARRAAKVENIRSLVEAGSGRAEVCARLKTTPSALGRFLAREGEHDLGREFYTAAKSEAS